MNCTNCGNELKPGQKFCTKCGTPVAVTTTATESKNIDASCPNCGNALKPGQKFCTKCGSPVAATGTKSAPQQANGVQCPQCGKALKPGQKFCTGCGAQISQPESGEKGFLSRVGAGIANAATGGSFSQGYAQQREKEEEYDTLRSAAEYAIKNAHSTMKKLLKEHKDIITYDDEVNVNELIAKIEKALAGNNAERGDRNSAIKKAINALEDELGRLRVKAEGGENARTTTQQERDTNRQTARGYQLSDYNEDELNVVQNKAIWGIQPGQIARRITERELDSVTGLNGFIIQEGCQAMIFVNGNLVASMDAGAYNVPQRSQQLLKQEFDKLYAEMEQQDKEKRSANSNKPQTIAERGGVVGIAGSYLRRGWEFLFGATPAQKAKTDKTNEERVQRLKAEVEKALKVKNPEPVMSVILVSKRNISLSFGGTNTENGIQFTPYTIPIGIFDVQMGVMLQLKVTDVSAFATNYLADKNSCTSNDFFNMLNSTIENNLRQNLRNIDYQREGLAPETVEMLKEQIKSIINQQLFGIVCAQVLQITDRNEDFDRFRNVEKELYCTEKELEYLQRTGEFRNRLAIETNKQTIQQATNDEDLRYALQQINKDQMLHDDELEQFVLLLNAQKRIREAKSEEDERQAYIDLKKSGLVKDEELAVLQDALEQNKIQRESITEIMRIQNNQSVSDARLKAEWALDDMIEDHDWEREDLARRRNWGIEDEEREREWQIEDERLRRSMEHDLAEAEHQNRMTDVELENARKRDEYNEQREDRQWEKDFEREQRQNDANWNESQRRRAAEWDDKERETRMRREDEQLAYDRQRQDKFDDGEIAMRNMQAMLAGEHQKREDELKQMQEANRSAENIHSMDIQAQMNRDNVEATMSAEALMAKQAAQLGGEGQVALAQALGSGKENELLQKQQAEQAALYQQMLQNQQAQSAQNQQLMMQMAQMMQQGMMSMGQANAANQQAMFNQQQQFQQQRYDEQKARAEEYKQDAYRQQDRMDAANQQALDFSTRSHQTDSQSFAQAMGGVPNNFQAQPQYQQPAQPQYQQPAQPQYQQPVQAQPAPKAGSRCPNCGMPVEPGDMMCGECGSKL
jgi:uncharacterized OB-fold protein